MIYININELFFDYYFTHTNGILDTDKIAKWIRNNNIQFLNNIMEVTEDQLIEFKLRFF